MFCKNFVYKVARVRSSSKKHSEKCWDKYMFAFMYFTLHFCQILAKHVFSQHFWKSFQIYDIFKIPA
jgi:hypothetical protein